jgi:hypothetical protein
MHRIQRFAPLPFLAVLIHLAGPFAGGSSARAQDAMDWRDMPHVVASTPSYAARNVAISDDGDTAYLAAAGVGLRVVDIGDPANPSELAIFSGDDYSLDVAVAGQYVYLPDRDAGLKIVDVSDPAAPTLAGAVPIPGSCFHVEAAGGLVYATDYWNVYVIDAADPSTAAIVATLPMSGGNQDLMAAGDRAYLASTGQGLCVIDLSVPTMPVLIAVLPLSGYVNDVVVVGDHAYVCASNEGVHVVDVSDPAAPVLQGSLDSIEIGDAANAIAERAGYVFLATTLGLQIVDVQDAGQPQLVNRVGGFQSYGVALRDDRVILGGDGDGMLVVDAGQPELTARTAIFETAGFTANDMVVRDGLGYVGYGGGGLQIVDLADPDAPVTVGTVETDDSVVRVEFYGDHVVACDLSCALYLIDVSDPASPVVVGSMPLVDIPTGLAVAASAGQAYVSINFGGVKIVDISDPAAPAEIYEIWDLWQPGSIAADYPYIYFTDYDHGFQAFDVSDPFDPVRVGTADGYGYGGGVALDLDAGVAYAAGEGLLVVDIADPAAMTVITEEPVPGWGVEDIALQGDMAYVAGLHAGVHAVDISDRRAPQYVATAMTGDEGRCIAASDRRVYLAAHFGQLEIYALHGGTPSAAPMPPPVAGALEAYPNPFNPRTTLHFALPRAARVELAIYDPRGRRVRELFAGDLSAGDHRLVWDGRDDGGRDAAAGVYLAQLRATGSARTTKLLLVR